MMYTPVLFLLGCTPVKIASCPFLFVNMAIALIIPKLYCFPQDGCSGTSGTPNSSTGRIAPPLDRRRKKPDYASNDPRKIKLSDFSFRPNERFIYEYNFTVNWEHQIRLTTVSPLNPGRFCPT
ncbi:MAG TPA: hypothetical protein DCP92_18960 [Nitrospiraceae bacterium]|nr:hypothetical protein [Nitrospiraceae bacterium]